MFENRLFYGGRCGVVITMRAAKRFGDDFVHNFQFHQIFGRKFEGGGGLRRIRAIFPQNGGATFGRDHRVVRVFQNQDAVAHTDAERATGTAFADDDGEQRSSQ